MSQNRSQYDLLNEMIKQASPAATPKVTPDKLRKMVEMNPKLESAINNLTAADIAKISRILNDKEATAKIMATPQAQELINKLKKS